jgi:hypothetical protein
MGGAMSSVTISGDTSGSIILQAPAVSGSTTLTLPTTSGTVLTTANTFGAGTGPTFSAYAGSGQSISSGTFTKVTCGTEEWDTNSNYDTSTSRFTPTVAGYYQVNGYVGFTSSTRTNTQAAIYKNGSQHRTLNQLDSNLYVVGGSSIVYLNGSTDYIELYVYSAASGTTDTGTIKTIFSAAMIRGA